MPQPTMAIRTGLNEDIGVSLWHKLLACALRGSKLFAQADSLRHNKIKAVFGALGGCLVVERAVLFKDDPAAVFFLLEKTEERRVVCAPLAELNRELALRIPVFEFDHLHARPVAFQENLCAFAFGVADEVHRGVADIAEDAEVFRIGQAED